MSSTSLSENSLKLGQDQPLLDPSGVWREGLRYARKAFDLETAQNLDEAVRCHEQAIHHYRQAKEAASGIELATLDRLIAQHEEGLHVLRSLSLLRTAGLTAEAPSSTLLNLAYDNHAPRAADQTDTRQSQARALTPQQLVTLEVLVTEAAAITREISRLATSKSGNRTSIPSPRIDLTFENESKNLNMHRMLEALRLRLATCRFVMGSQSSTTPQAASTSTIHSAAFAMTSVVTSDAAASTPSTDVSAEATPSSTLEEKQSKPKRSKSRSEVFELLVQLVEEKIKERIDEARLELAEDDDPSMGKPRSYTPMDGETYGEGDSSGTYTPTDSSSALGPSDAALDPPEAEAKRDTTLVHFSKPPDHHHHAATHPHTTSSPGEPTRTAQRAQSLLQEEGPLSSRERQSLESELNRTHFGKKHLYEAVDDLDAQAKEHLKDLAISYAHHILTRRRYRRATLWYKQTYEKLGTSYTALKNKLKALQSKK